MNNVAYKYISTISFSDLYNWSFQYAQKCENLFTNKYKCVPIGSFLVRIKDPVDIEDNQNYKRVSIKLYNGGITLRDIELGVNIGTKKQFRIKQGHFLLSKIDARNGAIGIVPESCNDAIITGNFWDFEIDTNKADPQFLSLLMTTDYFVKLFDKASNGTTNRHYLQEDLFLKTEIPLPSLDIQKEFVKKYNDKIKHAEEQGQKAQDLENDIEKYLFKELNVSIESDNIEDYHKSLISFIDLKTLSRWGVEYLINKKSYSSLLKSKTMPMKRLGDIVEIDPKNNFSSLDKDLEMSFIPMPCISDEYGEIIKLEDGVNEKSKGYTRFQEGDLIWAKITPCMQNGKSAILKGLKNGYGYGSTEFYVIRNSNPNVCLDYIYHILRTKIVRQNAMTYFTGSSGQQRVPKSYLQNLKIPLPEIKIQKSISDEIYMMKDKIKELKQQAEQNRIAAQEDFEKELFE